jgi:general secretion pathway protein E
MMGLARAQARAAGTRVVDALEAMVALPPAEFAARLAVTVHFALLTMDGLHRLQAAFDVLPYAEAVQHECLALRGADGLLIVAFSDPFDAGVRAWAEERVQAAFDFRLAHGADIRAYLSRHEESMRAMDSVLDATLGGDDAQAEAGESLSIASISEDDSPVVKLVSSTIYDALRAGASDIHVECAPSGLCIKYRIDGVLVAVGKIGGSELAEQVLSRIKVMAELDISERRVPQDGRFKVTVKGRAIDFRVSVMPSILGEDAVLRILDKQALTDQLLGLQLVNLGFDAASIDRMRKLAREPYGMLLVTGPTGSGKTTTLYAVLTEINNGQDKIITIEDPVEYQLRGITQIPINEKKGLTFARGLRSILRHDPDKIMVGEIRDSETAQIAIQSALTGHLVFTTVHANNVFDVLGRFLNMGVEPYQFISALNCVMAQRLVRKICEKCRQPVRLSREQLVESAMDPGLADTHMFAEGAGCVDCGGTGFKGRMAICELLDLTDHVRELILDRRPISEIKRAAKEQGMRFLRESAVERVMLGLTTLREINKVTFVE